jgi:hypothetical protein
LIQTGPDEWTCGVPEHWAFKLSVKKLGDSTWEELEQEPKPENNPALLKD